MTSQIAQFLQANVRTLVFLVGMALLSTGLAQVYLPSAWIVPGVLLVWLAIPPQAKVSR